MSLADLPDVLIAHLTSYMEYEDICNLMETSKKNYNAIKSYKKDKIKVDTLEFLVSDDGRYGQRFSAETNNEYGHTIKTFSCKRFDANAAQEENVKKVLKECSSVGKIEFWSYDITRDLYKALMETRVKIEHISVKSAFIQFTGNELATFCKKFKESNFELTRFMGNMFRDEILAPVAETTTQLHLKNYRLTEQYSAKLITDVTLKALFGRNSPPDGFDMRQVHNSFTIKELVKSLGIIRVKTARCHLGILQLDQLDDADRYFNKFTGELKDIYKIRIKNQVKYRTYSISVLNDRGRQSVVEFAVA